MTSATAHEIAQLITLCPTLPVPPGGAGAFAGNPRADTDQLRELLRNGAPLATNVLRLANEVHLRGRAPVSSVSDAVARLGLQKVAELALSDSYRAMIPPVLREYRIEAAAFWRHSVVVATLADRIGRRVAPREHYFAAGLLHDLGKLTICAWAEQTGAERPGSAVRFPSGERRWISTDHSEVGLEAARKWQLPAVIGAVAAWHHDPTNAPWAIRRVVCAVHLADGLAHALGYGAGDAPVCRDVSPEACALVGLDDGDLGAVCAECAGEIDLLVDAPPASVRGGRVGLGERHRMPPHPRAV